MIFKEVYLQSKEEQEMDGQELCFLGEKHLIPSDLREYVQYLHSFEQIYNDIISLLINQMEQKSFCGGADEDFKYFSVPLTTIGEKIIVKLSEHGVFDVTMDEVIFRNKGYIQLHNVCQETISQMAKILLQAIDDFKNGYENAQVSAASNITGSNVSLWTNSFSSALVYSALEASTLKKQYNTATREYNAAMSMLSKNVTDKREQKELELLVTKYYPEAADAIRKFVSELMLFYITKLESIGVFAYSEVEKYSLKRSTDLLKNLPVVTDKKSLLRQAFLYCPYNPDVYKAVLENGFADISTFKTAQYFIQDELLSEYIKDYCHNHISEPEKLILPIEIWSLYTNQDESNIVALLYSEKIQILTRRYIAAKRAIENKEELKWWIKEIITTSATKLCSMDCDKIRESIANQLDFNNMATFFDNYHLFDMDVISLPNSTALSLVELNREFTKTLLNEIKDYISELKVHVKSCIDEATKVEKEYQVALSQYNDERGKIYSNISELREELKKQKKILRLFKFNKQKEIENKLQLLQDKLSCLTNEKDPQPLKDKCEKLRRNAELFI